jgi:4-amino-4-deoxy-L-arabinose transferase-like glycosyltransferase
MIHFTDCNILYFVITDTLYFFSYLPPPSPLLFGFCSFSARLGVRFSHLFLLLLCWLLGSKLISGYYEVGFWISVEMSCLFSEP